MSGFLPGLIYGLGLNQSALPTGGGLQLGQNYLYTDPNGGFKELQVVKGSGTITANQALKYNDAVFTVVATGAVTDQVDGVNDVSSGTSGTGAAVTAGNFFLMTIRGNAKPLVAAGVAAGTVLGASAVAGQLAAWASPNVMSRLKNLAASGGGGATACYFG